MYNLAAMPHTTINNEKECVTWLLILKKVRQERI